MQLGRTLVSGQYEQVGGLFRDDVLQHRHRRVGDEPVRLRERERGRPAPLDLQVGVPRVDRRLEGLVGERASPAARLRATRCGPRRASRRTRSAWSFWLTETSAARQPGLLAPFTVAHRAGDVDAAALYEIGQRARLRALRQLERLRAPTAPAMARAHQLVVRRQLALEEPLPALGAPDDLEAESLDHLDRLVERPTGRACCPSRRWATPERVSASQRSSGCSNVRAISAGRRVRSRASPGRPRRQPQRGQAVQGLGGAVLVLQGLSHFQGPLSGGGRPPRCRPASSAIRPRSCRLSAAMALAPLRSLTPEAFAVVGLRPPALAQAPRRRGDVA